MSVQSYIRQYIRQYAEVIYREARARDNVTLLVNRLISEIKHDDDIEDQLDTLGELMEWENKLMTLSERRRRMERIGVKIDFWN